VTAAIFFIAAAHKELSDHRTPRAPLRKVPHREIFM